MLGEGYLATKAAMQAIEAAKLVVEANDKDESLNDNLCHTLRVLYFTESGVLDLLKDIDEGLRPTAERLEKALPDFNDREWRVEAALRRLNPNRLMKDLRITLETARTLLEIGHGKRRLRKHIQNEINYYGTKVRPNKKEVRRLIRSIEKLNAEIEKVERVVNLKAKERTLK